MPNYVPYLILIVASMSVIAFVMSRKTWRFVLTMHLCYSGMIYVFEIAILVVLEAYTYAPEVVKDPYLDSMIGAVISNFATVPSVSVLVAFYQLGWLWMISFAMFFGAVDVLFVQLGIYQHHWWRSYYSVGALLFHFPFNRFWFRKVIEGIKGFVFVSHFTFMFCVTNSTFFILMLLGWRRFQFGIFDKAMRDDVFGTNIVSFAITTLLVLAVYGSPKRLYRIPAAWICIAAGQYMLYRSNLLELFVHPGLYAAGFFACLTLVTWLCLWGHKVLKTQTGHRATG